MTSWTGSHRTEPPRCVAGFARRQMMAGPTGLQKSRREEREGGGTFLLPRGGGGDGQTRPSLVQPTAALERRKMIEKQEYVNELFENEK